MKLKNFEIRNDHIVITTDLGTFSGKDNQIQNEVTKVVEKLADKYKAYFEIMVNSDYYPDPTESVLEDKQCESCKIPEEESKVQEKLAEKVKVEKSEVKKEEEKSSLDDLDL